MVSVHCTIEESQPLFYIVLVYSISVGTEARLCYLEGECQ